MRSKLPVCLEKITMALAIGGSILMLTTISYAQGEPVTKRWLVEMSTDLGTDIISSTIESNGLAFLPTKAVRAELARTVNADIIKILPKHFASNTTFMVCEFTCENCGTSTGLVNTFNYALLDRVMDEKAYQNRDPHRPLYSKQMRPGLGPSAGPPREEELPVPIVVFVTGHISRESNGYRIHASLQYRDRGESPKPIASKEAFSSETNIRATAKTFGTWALDSLLDEVR